MKRFSLSAGCALLLTTAAWAENSTVPVTLTLTLADCIQRALTNNLELQIERLNPTIQQWGVVREQGAFEPAVTVQVSYDDATTPLSAERRMLLGLDAVESREWYFRAGLTGLLPTGTRYELSGYDTRSSGTFAPDPFYTGSTALTLTQPLLKNFWFAPNTAALRIARVNRRIAREQLASQIMETILAVSRAYYELMYAIENHKAKIEDLNRAKALLADNRKRVEVGVLSPLDITQAEAGVAEREEAVIVAERAIKDSENTLKRLISRDVAEFAGQTLLPADPPIVQMVDTDVQRSIQRALELRPELRQRRYDVEKQTIQVRYRRNQLWPSVNLQGSIGFSGRGNSFGDLASDVASGDNPAWSAGLVLTVPLGNRTERANYHIARLQAEQAELELRRLEQDIIVQVDNAVGRVQTNLKRLDATRAASRLAAESLKAEEAKLRAGTSTSFLVLQAQAQLAAARSAEIRAVADYNQSLVALARAEGTLLQQYNIVLPED